VQTSKLVGLTGGIASGKTLASDHLAEQGVAVVDTDVLAREVVMPGSQGLSMIVDTFGAEVLTTDGSLDRQRLKRIVFDDAGQLQQLNQIVHPLIRQQVSSRIEDINEPWVLVVIPLLTQQVVTGYGIDRVLLIDVPGQVQVERVMARDEVTEQMARNIIAAQPSRAERLQLAHDVVANHSSKAALIRRLDLLLPVYHHWASEQPG